MEIKTLIACGKHLHAVHDINDSSLPVLDKVRRIRSILDDASSCRVCSQVRALYAGYRREGWRTCLLCGARFENNKERLDHEKNHPIPPEAGPSGGCAHNPLGIWVTHHGASIVERGTNATTIRWNLWSLPEVVLRVVEEENGGCVQRNGWYYPRTRRSAAEVEDLWHHPQGKT